MIFFLDRKVQFQIPPKLYGRYRSLESKVLNPNLWTRQAMTTKVCRALDIPIAIHSFGVALYKPAQAGATLVRKITCTLVGGGARVVSNTSRQPKLSELP